MKYLMKDLFFLKNNMSWCTAYNCSNSSKNNPEFLSSPKKHGELF